MSCNNHLPHLLVLPEDRATSLIAEGFARELNNDYAFQVLPYAGGWTKVLDVFISDQPPKMRKFPERRIVLLIDFDEKKDRSNSVEERLIYVKNLIPDDIKNRVFILGAKKDPEGLTRPTKLKGKEIGKTLAQECAENAHDLWSHERLKHNELELKRLTAQVKPFLFKSL